MPANVNVSKYHAVVFGDDDKVWKDTKFSNFYNKNGKKAGVYTWNGKKWSYKKETE
jgi:hypothetical protein